MAEVLSTLGGFEPRPLIDPSFAELHEAMHEYFGALATQDCSVFYFSGHGYKGVGEKLFLCAKDFDQAMPARAGVPSREIKELMDGANAAKTHVLLLDCCYAGAFGKGMDDHDAEFVINTHDFLDNPGHKQKLPTGLYYLAAADHRSKAPTGITVGVTEKDATAESLSPFTRLLKEGLEGAAGGSEPEISADQLAQYVVRTAPRHHPKLVPVWGADGMYGSNIPLVSNRLPGWNSVPERIRKAIQSTSEDERIGGYFRLSEYLRKRMEPAAAEPLWTYLEGRRKQEEADGPYASVALGNLFDIRTTLDRRVVLEAELLQLRKGAESAQVAEGRLHAELNRVRSEITQLEGDVQKTRETAAAQSEIVRAEGERMLLQERARIGAVAGERDALRATLASKEASWTDAIAQVDLELDRSLAEVARLEGALSGRAQIRCR